MIHCNLQNSQSRIVVICTTLWLQVRQHLQTESLLYFNILKRHFKNLKRNLTLNEICSIIIIIIIILFYYYYFIFHYT